MCIYTCTIIQPEEALKKAHVSSPVAGLVWYVLRAFDDVIIIVGGIPSGPLVRNCDMTGHVG